MKFFTATAAFALFTVLAQAAPNKARTAVVAVRFEGADPDASYTKNFPIDGSDVEIGMFLNQTYTSLFKILYLVFA